MAEPRLSISSRRSQDSRSGASVSHGRGGAGNIGMTPDSWSLFVCIGVHGMYRESRLLKEMLIVGVDDTEYVDGGVYTSETAGLSGAGFSSGRGGAGNVKPQTSTTGSRPTSDRRDSINEESVVPAPKEGEGYSTGRGGGGNVHPAGVSSEKESLVNGTKKGSYATLGLA